MNAPLLSIFFLFCSFSLNASEASRVAMKMASAEQASTIQDHLIDFYGKELFNTGLFEDLLTAQKAASNECLEETQDAHYYLLVSNDSTSQYGCLLYSIDGQIAFLEFIYLDEAYRGKALGIESLQLLEKHLVNRGVQAIKLYVFAHNTAALSLYVRMGYRVENSYFEDAKPIGYHMKKEIIL